MCVANDSGYADSEARGSPPVARHKQLSMCRPFASATVVQLDHISRSAVQFGNLWTSTRVLLLKALIYEYQVPLRYPLSDVVAGRSILLGTHSNPTESTGLALRKKSVWGNSRARTSTVCQCSCCASARFCGLPALRQLQTKTAFLQIYTNQNLLPES